VPLQVLEEELQDMRNLQAATEATLQTYVDAAGSFSTAATAAARPVT